MVGKVVSEGTAPETDTTHVIIKNPETAQSDLAYLAKKLGLDIDQLREERLKVEKDVRAAELKERADKKKKAKQSHEEALNKKFLDNYGAKDGHYLLTVGGKRIQKLKDFSEITCPECGVELPLAWFCRSIMDMYSIAHPNAPLSDFVFYPARDGVVQCKNQHKVQVVVQYII